MRFINWSVMNYTPKVVCEHELFVRLIGMLFNKDNKSPNMHFGIHVFPVFILYFNTITPYLLCVHVVNAYLHLESSWCVYMYLLYGSSLSETTIIFCWWKLRLFVFSLSNQDWNKLDQMSVNSFHVFAIWKQNCKVVSFLSPAV